MVSSPAKEKVDKPVPGPRPQFRLPDETRLALLPWLAMGFGPVRTSASGLMCGLYALSKAFNAAQEALKAPKEEIAITTAGRLMAIFKGPRYKELATELIDLHRLHGFATTGIDQEVSAHSNLCINQIYLVLTILNEEEGTDFALGYITHGVKKNGKYVQPTVATLAGDALNVGSDAKMAARPVLWLWNDNSGESKKGSKAMNHWEGFGMLPANPNDPSRRRIKEWGLGATLKSDIKKRIWIVSEDCKKNTEHELEVKRGTFVTEVEPACPVPEDCRFVMAHNDERGLVPRERLQMTVTMNPAVSSLYDDPPPAAATASDAVTGQSGKLYKGGSEELADESPDELSEDQNQPKKQSSTQPEEQPGEDQPDDDQPDDDQPDEDQSEVQPTEQSHDQEEDLPAWYKRHYLKFFRRIDGTNKLGDPADDTVPLVAPSPFKLHTGNIFLDSSTRVGREVKVVNLTGQIGSDHARRLQSLEFPWGLPNPVRVMFEHDIKKQKQKDGQYPRNYFEGYSLPLWRLGRSYTAIEAQSTTDFLEGEVVRLIGYSEENNGYGICDYEANTGTVQLDDLSFLGRGCSNGEKYPFGIHLLEEIRTNEMRRPKQPADIISTGVNGMQVESDCSGEEDGENNPLLKHYLKLQEAEEVWKQARSKIRKKFQKQRQRERKEVEKQREREKKEVENQKELQKQQKLAKQQELEKQQELAKQQELKKQQELEKQQDLEKQQGSQPSKKHPHDDDNGEQPPAKKKKASSKKLSSGKKTAEKES